MELNSFNTVMLIVGLQHPEYEYNRYVFSYYNSKLNIYACYPRWVLYYSNHEQN